MQIKKIMVKIMVKKKVKMIGRKGRKTAPKTETFYSKKDNKYYKKSLSFWGRISAFLPYQKRKFAFKKISKIN